MKPDEWQQMRVAVMRRMHNAGKSPAEIRAAVRNLDAKSKARTAKVDETAALLVGLYRAHRRAVEDKWNRWACKECLVCRKWHDTEACLMGVCPECETKLEAMLGERDEEACR